MSIVLDEDQYEDFRNAAIGIDQEPVENFGDIVRQFQGKQPLAMTASTPNAAGQTSDMWSLALRLSNLLGSDLVEDMGPPATFYSTEQGAVWYWPDVHLGS